MTIECMILKVAQVTILELPNCIDCNVHSCRLHIEPHVE